MENIQPLCTACNGRKADRIIDYRPFALAHMPGTTLEQRVRAGMAIDRQICAPPTKKGA